MQPRMSAEDGLMEEPVFSLFPNPSSDGRFSIRTEAYDEEVPMVVEAFNLLGDRIASARVVPVTDDGVAPVLLDRPLESGVYLLRITVGESVTTERLVVR